MKTKTSWSFSSCSMLYNLIITICKLDNKFWGFNPYSKLEHNFLNLTSENSLKEFSVLCDIIKIICGTCLIDTILEHNKNKKFKLDYFSIFDLNVIINNEESPHAFHAKFLISKINLEDINQILLTFDLNNFIILYDNK